MTMKYVCLFMKKILLVFALVMFIPLSAAANKRVIAVWNVYNQAGNIYGQWAAENFKSDLTTILVNSGVYDVAERNQLADVIRELGLQQTSLVDSDTMVEIGKMAGADLTFTGNVVSANVMKQNNVLYDTVKAKVRISYKIIDNMTGLIKKAETLEDTASELGGYSDDNQVLIVNATKKVIRKIAEDLLDINSSAGRIVKVEGKHVYINKGHESGVRIGDMYVVIKEGNPIMDISTNRLLGVQEIQVGLVKVVDVDRNYCVAVIKKQKDYSILGDRVKKVTKR